MLHIDGLQQYVSQCISIQAHLNDSKTLDDHSSQLRQQSRTTTATHACHDRRTYACGISLHVPNQRLNEAHGPDSHTGTPYSHICHCLPSVTDCSSLVALMTDQAPPWQQLRSQETPSSQTHDVHASLWAMQESARVWQRCLHAGLPVNQHLADVSMVKMPSGWSCSWPAYLLASLMLWHSSSIPESSC